MDTRIRSMFRSESRGVPLLLFLKQAWVEYYPMGVIGIIVPWVAYHPPRIPAF
jgi:acyl-CoA reductase-like NAD-dependent aldehyde dehydrogenase